MNTFRYHFVFQKKSTNEDSYFPVLGKVSYSGETIVKWEPVVFNDSFKPLVDAYNESLKETNLMHQAKHNLPIKVNDDETLSFFHPNDDITFNENNETVLNYSYNEEKSSLINLDLDEDTTKRLSELGANTTTVEGLQKFHELLGKAFIEFIENCDDISDDEKDSLKKSLKTK